jgi:hypothetical protein
VNTQCTHDVNSKYASKSSILLLKCLRCEDRKKAPTRLLPFSDAGAEERIDGGGETREHVSQSEAVPSFPSGLHIKSSKNQENGPCTCITSEKDLK